MEGVMILDLVDKILPVFAALAAALGGTEKPPLSACCAPIVDSGTCI